MTFRDFYNQLSRIELSADEIIALRALLDDKQQTVERERATPKGETHPGFRVRASAYFS